jgi:hypothetical protein
MVFPVEEVCGGKWLVDECPPSSLYLTVLVIIYWVSGFPQGHLQSSGSLRRKGVLAGTGSVPPIEWGMWGENWRTWSGFGVHRTPGGQGS